MESLQAFRRIEEDKKRTVLKRVALEGPIITVLSRKATKPDGTPYAEEFVTFSDESMLKVRVWVWSFWKSRFRFG